MSVGRLWVTAYPSEPKATQGTGVDFHVQQPSLTQIHPPGLRADGEACCYGLNSDCWFDF